MCKPSQPSKQTCLISGLTSQASSSQLTRKPRSHSVIRLLQLSGVARLKARAMNLISKGSGKRGNLNQPSPHPSCPHPSSSLKPRTLLLKPPINKTTRHPSISTSPLNRQSKRLFKCTQKFRRGTPSLSLTSVSHHLRLSNHSHQQQRPNNLQKRKQTHSFDTSNIKNLKFKCRHQLCLIFCTENRQVCKR